MTIAERMRKYREKLNNDPARREEPKGRDCIFYEEQEVVCGIAEPQQGSRFATLTKYNWLMIQSECII